MNIIHLKYAVEVSKAGSINRAAEALLVGQPNLSRAIKELENSLGITIFVRTTKGMKTTLEGEKFLIDARKILRQFEELEKAYSKKSEKGIEFSFYAPRAGYIAAAFAEFIKRIDTDGANIKYEEASAEEAISKVKRGDCALSIIRYEERLSGYFGELIRENGLAEMEIGKFSEVLIARKDSELFEKKDITESDLREYMELVSPEDGEKTDSLHIEPGGKIKIHERYIQLEVLSGNDKTFMRGMPIPEKTLDLWGLAQRKVEGLCAEYKDSVVYEKEYKFLQTDKLFLEELFKSRDKIIKSEA